MVSLITDIVSVVLIIVMIVIAAKKGFLSGIVSLVGWVASAIVANTFCTVVSDYIYLKFVKNGLFDAIFASVSDYSASLSASISDVLTSLPETIQALLATADLSSLEAVLADPEISSEALALHLSDNIVGPVVLTILTALAFLIIFLLCMLIVRLLAGLFKNVKKIPLIGPVNTALGGVVGFVEAIVLLYVLKIVIEFVTTAAGGNLFGLTLADFDNSYVLKMLDFNF